ncbi:MAG: hypothetical protein WC648_04740, partial [Candidatus Paceibacterota bacterium]
MENNESKKELPDNFTINAGMNLLKELNANRDFRAQTEAEKEYVQNIELYTINELLAGLHKKHPDESFASLVNNYCFQGNLLYSTENAQVIF